MSPLSVVVISPSDGRRATLKSLLHGRMARVIQEFSDYPAIADLSGVLDKSCDVVIIDLGVRRESPSLITDGERALELIEVVCAQNASVTVMAYTTRNEDPEMLVRCMRAGAREFLMEPLSADTIAEALIRAAARSADVRKKATAGKVLTFTGAKGGSGVTTLAINFAVALAKESGGKVALVDFDLQLGDAALSLGLTTKFSVVDALNNAPRLDAEFVRTLLSTSSSGLSVLAAPDQYHDVDTRGGGTEKLLRILREEFAYIVVDAGSKGTDLRTPLFELTDVLYVVTEVSLPALRNANRFISRLANSGSPRLEIIVNRFDPRSGEIDDAALTKVLTRQPTWKVPRDAGAMKRAEQNGVPAALEKSAVANVIFDMVRTACGKPPVVEKKSKIFGLFG